MRTRIASKVLNLGKRVVSSHHRRRSVDIAIDSSYVKKVLTVNEVSIATKYSPIINIESNHLPANLLVKLKTYRVCKFVTLML